MNSQGPIVVVNGRRFGTSGFCGMVLVMTNVLTSVVVGYTVIVRLIAQQSVVVGREVVEKVV
jgi:hypothetical protein